MILLCVACGAIELAFRCEFVYLKADELPV